MTIDHQLQQWTNRYDIKITDTTSRLQIRHQAYRYGSRLSDATVDSTELINVTADYQIQQIDKYDKAVRNTAGAYSQQK